MNIYTNIVQIIYLRGKARDLYNYVHHLVVGTCSKIINDKNDHLNLFSVRIYIITVTSKEKRGKEFGERPNGI